MSGSVPPTEDESSKPCRVLFFDHQYQITGTKSPVLVDKLCHPNIQYNLSTELT